jgi:hypothetical protein
MENVSSNSYDPAHFVEVANGPHEGVRGWISDKELVFAR